MNLPLAILLLIGGLVILWKAAELLVAGAVGLAERLGISSLVVGLTVVAMGTSAPEVAASIAAVFKEAGGSIAIGNVYGSNIANLALVGGIAALIRPLRVQASVLKREIPAMLCVALLLLPLLINKYLSRPEAILLLAVFAALVTATIILARKESEAAKEVAAHMGGKAGEVKRPKTLARNIVFVGVGLVGLAGGAKMAVEGAVFVGRQAGLSESVIGLTIIAVGTSLPELMTCVVAAVKGAHDISIGNLVGSNIFNTLLVTGAAGTIRPFSIVPRLIGVDFWVMIGVSFAFALLILVGRRKIGRCSGALLVVAYVAYITYLLAGK